jgi:quercetin dioxygenase-like cupin family protein
MSLFDPVLTPPGAGESYAYGAGSGAELKIDGTRSGGDYGVVEWRVRAGDEPPIHTHTREDETVYLLAGEITAHVGDARFDVASGSYAALPKGVPHGFRVKGDEAVLLVTLFPAGAERFFVPPEGSDPLDAAEFGIEMLGPVPA